MISASASTALWLPLLTVLALETALVAAVVALLRRWSRKASWNRLCCQAGLVALLVIAIAELSGASRSVAGWVEGFPTFSKRTPPLRDALIANAHGATVNARARSPQALEPPPGNMAVPTLRSAVAGSEAAKSAASPTVSVAAVAVTTGAGNGGDFDSSPAMWLWLLWLVGTAVGLARACLGRVLAALFRLRHRAAADPAQVGRVQALAQALGLRRTVRVVQSPRLRSPIAFGFVHPTVGLPLDFTSSFDAGGQEAILAHEVAHLAAYDPFWCFVADLAAAVLWWHPAVWWLRRQLHVAGELVADEASLLVADGPESLAECLVALGARLNRGALPGPLGVASFRSHLGRRVQRLVQMEGGAWSPPPRFRAAWTGFLGSVAMVAIALAGTAWVTPQALKEGDSMKTIRLSWKRSLAAVALLAAVDAPDSAVRAEQSDPPTAATATASTNQDVTATEAPKTGDAAARDAFARRYGLGSEQAIGVANSTAEPAASRPQLAARPEAAEGKRGSRLEATLKRLLLTQVHFDGLPLNEVLTRLSDESVKLDPEKVGVNFLINPNFPPAATSGHVDPATGLPVAIPSDTFEMSQVLINFSLPLRHVTMKDVLDAIVTVADHPIQYSLEDYAVVFSPKPQTIDGQPVIVGRAEAPQPSGRPQVSPAMPEPSDETVTTTPHRFNVDFGAGGKSEQVGPAVAGEPGDFWNTVAVGYNDAHTESGLKFAGGEASPVRVEMLNLGGGWELGGHMGVKSPMLDTYDYPANNKGGDAQVNLHRVPPGKYDLFLYGHGMDAMYYGDYSVLVGKRSYGRKSTSHRLDAVRNTKWVEGSQYVRFRDLTVEANDDVQVLIRPGGPTPAPGGGGVLQDAMIAGLQLIPSNECSSK